MRVGSDHHLNAQNARKVLFPKGMGDEHHHELRLREMWITTFPTSPHTSRNVFILQRRSTAAESNSNAGVPLIDVGTNGSRN